MARVDTFLKNQIGHDVEKDDSEIPSSINQGRQRQKILI